MSSCHHLSLNIQADDPNKAAQLLSHAVLGAIIAYMNGGDPVAGAASATASELASMVLAKELYSEAFDEDGNLVRSRLSEEQAQGIVAITNAIGALAGGITGGDAVNTSLGSFIGENAVVNNTVSVEQAVNAYKYLYKGCVADGHKDCNEMHVILVDGSTDNYRVVGSSYLDEDFVVTTAVGANGYYAAGNSSAAGGGQFLTIAYEDEIFHIYSGQYVYLESGAGASATGASASGGIELVFLNNNYNEALNGPYVTTGFDAGLGATLGLEGFSSSLSFDNPTQGLIFNLSVSSSPNLQTSSRKRGRVTITTKVFLR